MEERRQCEDHRECVRKLGQVCIDLAGMKERINHSEEAIHQLEETIFGGGSSETLKSRLQKAEDGVDGLKGMVLENREMVAKNFENFGKSIVKFVLIMISLATLVISGMFGLLWTEIKGVQATVVQVNR